MIFAPATRSSLLCKIDMVITAALALLAFYIVTNTKLLLVTRIGFFVALLFFTLIALSEVIYFSVVFKKPCGTDRERGVFYFPNELTLINIEVNLSDVEAIRAYYSETFRIPSVMEFKLKSGKEENMTIKAYYMGTIEQMISEFLNINPEIKVFRDYEIDEITHKVKPVKTPVR